MNPAVTSDTRKFLKPVGGVLGVPHRFVSINLSAVGYGQQSRPMFPSARGANAYVANPMLLASN